jgi:hypothetical protein
MLSPVRPVEVAIIEAASMMHARLRATPLNGMHAGWADG